MYEYVMSKVVNRVWDFALQELVICFIQSRIIITTDLISIYLIQHLLLLQMNKLEKKLWLSEDPELYSKIHNLKT